MAHGRLASFSLENGFGILKLDDGREISADVHAFGGRVPSIGSAVAVQIGVGRTGRPKVMSVVALRGVTRSLPALLQRWGDPGQLLCLDARTGGVAKWPFPASLWPIDMPISFRAQVVCDVDDEPALYATGWGGGIRAIRGEALSPGDRKRLISASEPADAESFLNEEAVDGRSPTVTRRPTAFPLHCDGGHALAAATTTRDCDVCGASPSRACVAVDDTGRDIAHACDTCVRAGRVFSCTPEDFAGAAEALHPTDRGAREIAARSWSEELRRTSAINFQHQQLDWPIHCEKLCESLGHPAGRQSFTSFLVDGARLWSASRVGDPGDAGRLAGNEPETWDDVSCFQCRTCGQRLFTDQYT